MSLPPNDPNMSPERQLRNAAALNAGGGLSFASLGNLQNLQGLSSSGGLNPALLSTLGGLSSSGLGSASGGFDSMAFGGSSLGSQRGSGLSGLNLQQDVATLANVQNQVNAAELRALLQGGAGPADLALYEQLARQARSAANNIESSLAMYRAAHGGPSLAQQLLAAQQQQQNIAGGQAQASFLAGGGAALQDVQGASSEEGRRLSLQLQEARGGGGFAGDEEGGVTTSRRLSAVATATHRLSESRDAHNYAMLSPNDDRRHIKSLAEIQSQPHIGGDLRWEEYAKGSVLAVPEIKGLVSDALFLAVAQMKPCGLTLDDRVGKYKSRELGFVGMCCKWCNGTPGFGRYFPGSFDSFLNGKNCEGIIKHIAAECRVCPAKIRDTVLQLEREEGLRPSRKAYGSRKRFVKHIWDTLRTIKLGDQPEATTAVAERPDGNDIPWEAILAGNEIVTMNDVHLVQDSVTVALAQMKRCHLTAEDQVGRCKGHKVGFVGLCCKHCGGKAGKPGYGRYFPSSLRSLTQVDSCQHIINHITKKCPKVPTDIRSIILELQLLEKTERIRYGSRSIFFRRVWTRLHGDASSDTEDYTCGDLSQQKPPAEEGGGDKGGSSSHGGGGSTSNNSINIPWDTMVEDSELLTPEDRGLISDAQFAALTQVEPCKLTPADRVGWYKLRPIGFPGLRCKHCGGRPSYGRYFPNSVRSFAQTSSSQTIISHMTLYCKECPPDICQIIQKLQRRENSNQTVVDTAGSALYGSRKVFYERVWARLHGAKSKGWDVEETEVKDPPPEYKMPAPAAHGDDSDEASTEDEDEDDDVDDDVLASKRKSLSSEGDEEESKRRKVFSSTTKESEEI